jgi:hypothetical protein
MQASPQSGVTPTIRRIIHARCGRDVLECTCEFVLRQTCDCPDHLIYPAWRDGVRVCLNCDRRL